MTGATGDFNEYEKQLNVESLLAASGVLSALQGAFGEIREPSKGSVTGCLTLNLAQSYVIELAAHLQGGMAFDAAVQATVRGDMKIA